MKNKQILIEWGWENSWEFEILPTITIVNKNEVDIKWLKFVLSFYHPSENIFNK